MTLVREANTALVAQYSVPYKGTWNSVAANQVAPDALYESENVFIRQGKLRTRPGLLLLNGSTFDAPIIGGAMSVTPTKKILLAISKSALFTLDVTQSNWATNTTTGFASTDDSIVDLCFIETSSQYVAVIASAGYTLKRWLSTGTASTIIPSAGTVPTAISVCTAARRIVALVDPHTVQWTATLTYDNWPALAIAKLAQTNDVGICVRALRNLTFVVYKERSIYLARAQAGSDANAFAFAEPLIVEGPAGIHAVVELGGYHMYITRNGRIAVYDGIAYPKWIADGLWIFLQGNIDPVYAHKISGSFDYRLNTVTFVYPKVGDSGLMYGLIIICLPLEGSGIDTPAVFLGTLKKPVSHAYEMRFNNQIDRSLLFTSTSGDANSFIFDEETGTDDGTIFNCHAQTALITMPDLAHYQVSVENFFERANGYGGVTVQAVTLDALENSTGTTDIDNIQTIDLNSNPVREYIGFNIPTRFFGLRYSWQSTSTVKFAGASVYARVLG